jgi:hypothetical protein
MQRPSPLFDIDLAVLGFFSSADFGVTLADSSSVINNGTIRIGSTSNVVRVFDAAERGKIFLRL